MTEFVGKIAFQRFVVTNGLKIGYEAFIKVVRCLALDISFKILSSDI